MAPLTPDDLQKRRFKVCVEAWSEAESGEYNPKCCRYPKSCSPYGSMSQVIVGTVTENELEDLMSEFMPETILTYWSPEHPCVYCGSTTNTGHIPSCQDADLYDWRGVSIPAVPKPVPTWYELKVVFQASDIIRLDQLKLAAVTDIAWALVKELSKYGVDSSIVSSAELEPVSLRRV